MHGSLRASRCYSLPMCPEFFLALASCNFGVLPCGPLSPLVVTCVILKWAPSFNVYLRQRLSDIA